MKALPFTVKPLAFTLCFLLVLVLLTPGPIAAQDFRERKSHEDVGFVEDDVKTEIRFGREIAARILGRYRPYEDEKLTRYVNLVGRTVASQAGRAEIEFHFGILRAEFVNAFAAPGGYVFITKGALDKVRDEAELAAVLAHEIAHVTERHIVEELNIRASDDSPVAGVARMIGATGDPAKVAFLKAADKALNILMERGYKIGDPNMPYIIEPCFDILRDEPRFHDLLRKMNLPMEE